MTRGSDRAGVHLLTRFPLSSSSAVRRRRVCARYRNGGGSRAGEWISRAVGAFWHHGDYVRRWRRPRPAARPTSYSSCCCSDAHSLQFAANEGALQAARAEADAKVSDAVMVPGDRQELPYLVESSACHPPSLPLQLAAAKATYEAALAEASAKVRELPGRLGAGVGCPYCVLRRFPSCICRMQTAPVSLLLSRCARKP